MFTQAATIDSAGRLTLPKPILEALGVEQAHETEVVIELTEMGVVIKLKNAPITERLAAMNLPVDRWEQMEEEIEAERVK